MSKYLELLTQITDERYLVEALQELGYAPEICREGSKSLERRVRRKAPLFADRIIAEEIAANPNYFNPAEE